MQQLDVRRCIMFFTVLLLHPGCTLSSGAFFLLVCIMWQPWWIVLMFKWWSLLCAVLANEPGSYPCVFRRGVASTKMDTVGASMLKPCWAQQTVYLLGMMVACVRPCYFIILHLCVNTCASLRYMYVYRECTLSGTGMQANLHMFACVSYCWFILAELAR
jgi:hypothetical protein